MKLRAGRLKILYHHRTRARDGQSVHIDELIHALRGLGHEVIVVEPHRVDATAQTLERRLIPQFLYELAEICYSLVEFVKLAIAAIRHRPDALYERANLFMLSGLWTARLFQIPYLLEVNSPLAEERARSGGLSWPRLAAWTEQTCWKGATMAMPVTQALAGHLLRSGVLPERIAVTPNGVNPLIFFPKESMAAKARLGRRVAAAVLAHVDLGAVKLDGTLAPSWKGPAEPALDALTGFMAVLRAHVAALLAKDPNAFACKA